MRWYSNRAEAFLLLSVYSEYYWYISKICYQPNYFVAESWLQTNYTMAESWARSGCKGKRNVREILLLYFFIRSISWIATNLYQNIIIAT